MKSSSHGWGGLRARRNFAGNSKRDYLAETPRARSGKRGSHESSRMNTNSFYFAREEEAMICRITHKSVPLRRGRFRGNRAKRFAWGGFTVF